MKLEWVCVMAYDWETTNGWQQYKKETHREEMKLCPLGGLLVDKDEDWTVLAVGFNPSNGDFLGIHSIPTACIKTMTVLRTEEE